MVEDPGMISITMVGSLYINEPRYMTTTVFNKNIFILIFKGSNNRNQHQDGDDERLPSAQRSNQYHYNRSSGQTNINRGERRGGGPGGNNSAPRGNRGGGNRRTDDRRRTADDEHTVLDNAHDSGDRGKQ